MKYQIFIIHSPEEDGVASALCRALEEGSVSCWRSRSDNLRNAKGASAKVINNSDAVVLILSSVIKGSAQVKWEVESAAKAGKEIIPFRIDTTPLPKYLEFYLSTAHWLDATTPPLEKHITQLVYAVRYLLGLEKERASKKAVAAMIFGILGLIVIGGIFSLIGIILGGLELKSIASGRSSTLGRKYARIGIICGLVGIVLQIAGIWYFGNPLNWFDE